MSERIYLDHAATTPVRREVREAMAPFLEERFGNPSSLHAEGRAAREALEAARETLRDALGAGEFDVVFTGGGTESDNAAIVGRVAAEIGAGRAPGDVHVLATAVEHVAVLETLDGLSRWGVGCETVAVDRDARVDPADVVAALRPHTALVSVMAANNEVGTLEPLEEIGRALRERGVPFHTDAIQLLGRGRLDLRRLPVDLVSVSGHKVGAPKGVGALLVRRGVPHEAFLRGGGQQGGRRGGTEAVAAAVGLATAVRLAVAEEPEESARLRGLAALLRRATESRLDGVAWNTPERDAAPHILNATFEGVEGESLLKALDGRGVAVSTGSACNVGASKPSHVLAAMGRDARAVRGSLRFSVGRDTAERAIEVAVARLDEAVRWLRSLSPLA